MNNNIEKIIESAQKEAEEILKSTSEIRKAFVVGRPNSSKESTVEGTLEAFSVIVSSFNPGFTTA